MTPQKTALALFETLDFSAIKDQPNLLIAAHFFDADRFEAAKTCCTLLQAVAGLVDDYKADHPNLSEAEREDLMQAVNEWISRLLEGARTGSEHQTVVETFERFMIPLWAMLSFARSMIYEIMHDGFPSLKSFLDYSKGASVAPTSIFFHLCGLQQVNGAYLSPRFDVRTAASPGAYFSAIVQVIRNFQKDSLNKQLCFANDILEKEGLSQADLADIAAGAPISEAFRNVIRTYYRQAELYKEQTQAMIDSIKPQLEPGCRLSLSLVFALDTLVFDRIDPDHGTFSTEALSPTASEIRQVVYETIMTHQN